MSGGTTCPSCLTCSYHKQNTSTLTKHILSSQQCSTQVSRKDTCNASTCHFRSEGTTHHWDGTHKVCAYKIKWYQCD